jgi:NADP-dependent 3-hydroxy acid dehydrogenase YdfG
VTGEGAPRAVIAGSSGDIGRAVAGALREAGFATIGLTRSGRYAAAVDQLVELDLANPLQVRQAADGLFAHAPVRIVVNAAGTFERAHDLAAGADVLKNNLAVADNLLAAFTRHMVGTAGSRFITIASIDGLWANPSSVAYSVAKAGVRALVHSYRKVHRDAAVNFDLVSPGAVATRMRADKTEDKSRLLQPDDIARVCVFLSSLPPRVAIDEIVLHPKSFADADDVGIV